jgi:hypothetical protein
MNSSRCSLDNKTCDATCPHDMQDHPCDKRILPENVVIPPVTPSISPESLPNIPIIEKKCETCNTGPFPVNMNRCYFCIRLPRSYDGWEPKKEKHE